MARRSRKERGGRSSRRSKKRDDYSIDIDESFPISNTTEDIKFEEDVYRTVGPTQNRIKRSLQRYKLSRYLIVASAILALFMGSTLLYSARTANLDRKAAEVPSFHTRYEALGAQIVTNYLQQLPPPNVMMSSDVKWPNQSTANASESDPKALQELGVVDSDKTPSISGVTLDWGERYPMPLNRTAQLPDIPTPSGISMVEAYTGETFEEVLRYYVVMNGQPVMMNINLLVPPKTDYTTVPVLLSAPTITEVPRGTMLGNSVGVKDSPAGRDGYLTFKSNAGLEDTLSRFASAWAKNDQGTLKLLTRDSTDKQYSGLGGWESTGDVRVLWGAQDTEMRKNDQAYVQATFTIEQTVVEESSGDKDKAEEKTYQVVQTVDFLIGGASTDSPSVLAWGTAGTWPDLKPGVNALPDNKDVQAPGDEIGSKDGKDSSAGLSESSSSSTSENSSSDSSGDSSGSYGSGSSRGDNFEAPAIDDDYSSDDESEDSESGSDEQCQQLGIC